MRLTWLSVLTVLVVLLLIVSTLDHPIKRILRSRWPDFDYDSQSILTWGVATLGALTMLLFLALMLERA
jgi:formate-dependent nitrite reductase membrane component NrfD